MGALTGEKPESIGGGRIARVLGLLVLLAFVLVLFNTAWLCDDAFITFRVADNAVHGYGLRWNVDERVQAYTNPLWLFLISAIYFVTREMFFTPLFLSLAISVMAVVMLAMGLRGQPRRWMALLFLLTCSRAFVDYSTSGLENPLTHLLLAGFLLLLFQDKPGPGSVFLLSFLTHLSMVNRMDTALLLWPALAYFAWKRRSFRTAVALIAGMAPYLIWELFSTAYYGSPFPNTAYAKLGGGLSRGDLLVQGVLYFADSLWRDHLTLPAIVLTLLVCLRWREARRLSLALGIVLYLGYVLWAGGDFMSGRFFAAPMVCAAAVLARMPFRFTQLRHALACLVMLLLSPYVPRPMDYLGDQEYTFASLPRTSSIAGVADERAFYFQDMALKLALRGKAPMQRTDCAKLGRKQRAKGPSVQPFNAVGVYGFLCGPAVHVIDMNALGDPLLARLPALYTPVTRPGHYTRGLPAGYVLAVREGPERLEDPDLREYYRVLTRITRDPVWSAERWRDVIAMNLGRYDPLLHADRYRFPDLKRVSQVELNALKSPVTFGQGGIEVALERVVSGKMLQVALSSDYRYDILFMRGDTVLWRSTTGPGQLGREELTPYTIQVPTLVRQQGCTALRLMPWPWEMMHWLNLSGIPEGEVHAVNRAALLP